MNTPGVSTWTPIYTDTGNNPAWDASDTDCPSTAYVFGYRGYSTTATPAPLFESAKLTYFSTHSSISQPHYGIHFRGAFLFIDEW